MAVRFVNASIAALFETVRMIRIFFVLMAGLLLSCEQVPDVDDRLHRLAEQGETRSLIDAIVETGNVDQRDVCYRTPLMFAAQFGRIDTVRELVTAGAQVNLHEKGYYTALMLAAGNGHAAVVEFLADAGAAIDEVEFTRDWTALIWSAKRGHTDTVRLLLQRGARRDLRDDRGRTALDWARIEGHTAVVALFE
jgi:ankyrin repeat protein